VQTDTVYFLGPPEVYSGHGAIRFVSHGAVVTDVEDIRAVALPEEPTDHNLYFLFTPGHFPDVAFVQARYPHGTLEQWRDGAEPYLIGYRVAREQDTARRDDAP
jgi:hypothetical protein